MSGSASFAGSGSACLAASFAGVGFRYRTRPVAALRGVDLEIEPGETLVVLGPSGSGKSTLTLCLNGLIPHHIAGDFTGTVRIDGQDTRTLPPAHLAQLVGMVFQDPEAQFCLLKAADEVAFGLENLGVPRDQMRPRIEHALAQVGLGGRGDERIERLSGGEKQRLALATALVMQPRALVFDEPTANLDAVAAADFFGWVRRARGERTLVIVEHRVEHALPLADRVLVLGRDGSPIALGAPRDVLRECWSELVEGGVWLPEVAELALRRGVRDLPLTIDEAFDLESAVGAVFASYATPSPLPEPPSPPAVDAPAVTVRELRFAYGERSILRDVTCDIPAARLTAVVGPNGSGKTTFVSHLAGILKPPPGRVSVFDHDAHILARRPDPRLVGFVFQNPEHQFLTHRVFDEVAWGLRRLRVPEAEITARVEGELTRLGLRHLADVIPYKLSGGEKRRLSLATALVLEPRLLVFDEPTFGQDSSTSAALVERMHELIAQGTTIVLVTHDMRLVANDADHVILLVDGGVAYQGPPGGLLSDERLLQRGRLLRPPLLELARRLGWPTSAPELASVEGWVSHVRVPLETVG